MTCDDYRPDEHTQTPLPRCHIHNLLHPCIRCVDELLQARKTARQRERDVLVRS